MGGVLGKKKLSNANFKTKLKFSRQKGDKDHNFYSNVFSVFTSESTFCMHQSLKAPGIMT